MSLFTAVLYRHRHLISPPAKDEAMKCRLRAGDTRLSAFTFLFVDYRPVYMFMESVELLRRVMLIGGVKLLGQGGQQAAFSALGALLYVFVFDYTQPYVDKLTNLLACVPASRRRFCARAP